MSHPDIVPKIPAALRGAQHKRVAEERELIMHAPDDLREQARLCLEQAEAATGSMVRRAFASHALPMAQLAQVIAARLGDKPTP